MGAFVEPFESVNLSQALITDGCELKVIISQKKLMLVQMLVEVFGLLTASIQTIKE
jgi:hypothetical protein